MYASKQFRVRTLEEIELDIASARATFGPAVRRVFLADGDAMCLSTRRLIGVLDALNAAFPRLQRVGIYANARDVAAKSDEELAELRRRKLRILYVGLESGDDETLAAIDKGATSGEIVGAVQRAQAAGMKTSVMVLVGVAGRARSLRHARASADAINAMAPAFTALLTCTPVKGTRFADRIRRRELEIASPLESIREIREFVAGLACQTYFTCNHASNYLPLVGRMPGARGGILAVLDAALGGDVPLRPEGLRGL
jgi:radical SAM superfamily enzyme YgiQ (UPF0313 family)